MRPRYLRPALTMPQIYLYRAPIDFRKQAHGLAAVSIHRNSIDTGKMRRSSLDPTFLLA